MKYLLISLLILGTMVGCAGKVQLAPGTLQSFAGSSLAAVTHEAPSFDEMTLGRATMLGLGAGIGGGVGGLVYESSRDDGKPGAIQTPDKLIATKIADSLRDRYNLIYSGNIQGPIEDRDIEAIIRAGGGSPLILSVATHAWGLQYYTLSFRYRTIYRGIMQLIDTNARKVLARENCVYNPDQDSDSPTYDELTANNGKMIQEQLLKAADLCAQQFLRNQLG